MNELIEQEKGLWVTMDNIFFTEEEDCDLIIDFFDEENIREIRKDYNNVHEFLTGASNIVFKIPTTQKIANKLRDLADQIEQNMGDKND